MRTKNQRIGASGEAIALDYLLRKGYTLLAKNYRTAYGELDLVTRIGNTTVFVEVKTRTSDLFGRPEEGVTAKKQATLAACTTAYLDEQPHPDSDWQIDVIAVRLFPNQPPQITHFENAVEG